MYPHFIEVHDVSTGSEQLVHIDTIEGIFVEMVAPEVFATHIDLVDGDCYQVTESYDDLKQLIRDCGCAITKADPRLDMSIPLSMDDLCKPKMIGEPVFNSNTRAWMLVADSALDNSSWVDLVDHAGKIVRFGPHDVVKYPLYRMRKDG